MNLRISDPKIEELAQELATRTGEDPTVAVIRALEERLDRQPVKDAPLDEAAKRADRARREAAIKEITEHIKKLPVLDDRTPDEMLYDEYGLPK
jgi:antitoxin VapB